MVEVALLVSLRFELNFDFKIESPNFMGWSIPHGFPALPIGK